MSVAATRTSLKEARGVTTDVQKGYDILFIDVVADSAPVEGLLDAISCAEHGKQTYVKVCFNVSLEKCITKVHKRRAGYGEAGRRRRRRDKGLVSMAWSPNRRLPSFVLSLPKHRHDRAPPLRVLISPSETRLK